MACSFSKPLAVAQLAEITSWAGECRAKPCRNHRHPHGIRRYALVGSPPRGGILTSRRVGFWIAGWEIGALAAARLMTGRFTGGFVRVFANGAFAGFAAGLIDVSRGFGVTGATRGVSTAV